MASVPPSRPSPAPFIVTAELPPAIFSWANALRQAHFPPERNVLAAHVTLFHSFAPSLREELLRTLGGLAKELAPPDAVVDGLMNLGGGTALAIRSPGMLAVRDRIARQFHGALTRQDQHEPRLHITVQNKVSPQAARALQADLVGYTPRAFRFTGLGLHLYLGPRWDALGTWSFRGKEYA
ncbi:2'-5' RNA ligase superfamily protein [Novosphingobium kunmingense]|uniref:2'-5' RNA ligase superfamily protein n=1 Tax=Novosphingobium kunmingense TaxID=1211806 RepID=A0A2N0I338_9SPHN|nr:2'-5' RNA ligase family protein [Novosphingobium kunmingense]PKB25609.1 2'-5' RNA ligase superfamily protein [Novosphingobium kunmingense]